MIITLTPNPSLDRTMRLERLARGAVNRALESFTEPAGKGVNISRALAGAGVATLAIVPLGGANGAELGRLLSLAGVDYRAVPIAGEVRSNVTVIEPDGTVTKLNEPGPDFSESEIEGLVQTVVSEAETSDWVVASGSLAPGMPTDLYRSLGRSLHGLPAKLAVDTSGVPLHAAVEGGPDLLKPNLHELRELAGRRLLTLGDALAAAQDVVELGVGRMLVSLGEDGALLVDADSAVHGEVTIDRVLNTVGAGDALLAGFLASGGSGPDALRGALSWARRAVRSPQTSMAEESDADAEAVRIHADIDLDRVLRDEESEAGSPGS